MEAKLITYENKEYYKYKNYIKYLADPYFFKKKNI